MLQYRNELEFKSLQECEQFQLLAFGISCATCGRSDRECPWERRPDSTMPQMLSGEIEAQEQKKSAAAAA